MRNNKSEQRQRNAVRFLFALGALLAFVFTLAGVGGAVGFALATTGTLIGEARETSGPDTHRTPSVSDVLTRLEPSRYPFTTFLDRLSRTAPATQIVHRWGELSTFPRSITVNGATLEGSANTAKQITVDAVNLIKVNDILMSPANATDATLRYLVTSIDSATTLKIQALPKDTAGTAPYTAVNFGTVPVLGDNEVLYWIGNAKSENQGVSASRSMQPAYKFNYVQTFDQVMKWSDHKSRSKNYGPNDIARYKADMMREYRKSQELAAIFNGAPAIVADANNSSELIWVMGGLKHYVGETISMANSGGVPSVSQVVDFIYACFDDNNGSERKMLMGGAGFLKSVDKANTSDLFIARSETVVGVKATLLEGRIGQLYTVYHPGFDEMGATDEAVVVDMNHIYKRVYQPDERRVLDLKKAGTADADGEQVITKWTTEIRNPDVHKWCNKA